MYVCTATIAYMMRNIFMWPENLLPDYMPDKELSDCPEVWHWIGGKIVGRAVSS